jgi:hypothetical protein
MSIMLRCEKYSSDSNDACACSRRNSNYSYLIDDDPISQALSSLHAGRDVQYVQPRVLGSTACQHALLCDSLSTHDAAMMRMRRC